ncbi:MAG: DUF4168 domain-containing protein, partial [Rhodanobacteraceae bacterium]
DNRMTQRLQRTAAAVAVTMGLALTVPAAFAQTQPAQTPPAQPQQTPTQGSAAAGQPGTGPAPSDAELKDFAHAAVDVQNIRKTMQPKLAAAQSADAQTKVKAAAEKQMESAVRSNHLSLQRYVQIAQVVQTNSAIRAKVQSYMPPARSKS